MLCVLLSKQNLEGELESEVARLTAEFKKAKGIREKENTDYKAAHQENPCSPLIGDLADSHCGAQSAAGAASRTNIVEEIIAF